MHRAARSWESTTVVILRVGVILKTAPLAPCRSPESET